MSGPSPDKLECHGQLPGAPIFSVSGGEIMYVQDLGDGTVQIFYEDHEEPGTLIPEIMNAQDYFDLHASQPLPPEEEYPED